MKTYLTGILVFLGLFACGLTSPDHIRLVDDLLSSYSKAQRQCRPVFNISETVNVQFGLAVVDLIEFDEETKVITLSTWLRKLWNDANLIWDPSEYNGVDHIYLDPKFIWTPDITLYNNYDVDIAKSKEETAIISSDGSVMLITPAHLRVRCNEGDGSIACRFKVGSWVYDGFKLDINFWDGLEQIDITDYVASNEYEASFPAAVKNVKYYPCCVEPYPDLTFNMRLTRYSNWPW